MTVQEAIDEVMSMKFAGGCGQYTKEAVLIVCAAAKHAIEEGESKKHLRKKIEGKLVTYNIDYLLENLQEEVKKWENYKAANERFKATMDRMIERLDDAKRKEE